MRVVCAFDYSDYGFGRVTRANRIAQKAIAYQGVSADNEYERGIWTGGWDHGAGGYRDYISP